LAKTISLPEVIYEDLTSISEELVSIARKPISSAMTISLLIAVYRAHLSEPCARDAFRQKIATSDFISPEAFERAWDSPPPKVKRKHERKQPRG
jgi:hypothetical protein